MIGQDISKAHAYELKLKSLLDKVSEFYKITEPNPQDKRCL